MLKKIERRTGESFAEAPVGGIIIQRIICFSPADKLLPVGHFESVLNNVSFRK